MAGGAAVKLRISSSLLADSLAALREGGRLGEERVLLWLALPQADVADVRELLVPEQEAASDYFAIPGSAIARLCRHLDQTGYFVPCQVHSHPAEAFHSAADDRWALVRHVGGLSLVVPHFALRTEPSTFIRDTAAFELDATDRWRRVEVTRVLEVVA